MDCCDYIRELVKHGWAIVPPVHARMPGLRQHRVKKSILFASLFLLGKKAWASLRENPLPLIGVSY